MTLLPRLLAYVAGCTVLAIVTGAAPRDLVIRRHRQGAEAAVSKLAAEILDGQILRLEENGLEKLPLHADLTRMRADLDAVVTSELGEVVAQLAASGKQDEQREAAVEGARRSIRAALVRLIAKPRAASQLSLADSLRELSARQVTVEDQTRLADPSEEAVERLVTAQTAIRRDLKALTESVLPMPAALAILEDALLAADEAASELFDGRLAESLDAQARVRAQLDRLERLRSATGSPPARATEQPAKPKGKPRQARRATADYDVEAAPPGYADRLRRYFDADN